MSTSTLPTTTHHPPPTKGPLMTTTQLPTAATDLTAGHVATALRAVGHDARVEYEGHGIVYVTVPLPSGDRILVHSYSGSHLAPEDALIDSEDGWPGTIVDSAEGEITAKADAEAVWLDTEAPDVPSLYASLTVRELLSFTVAAVAESLARATR